MSDLWKDSRNVVTPLQEYAPNIFARFKERCFRIDLVLVS